MMADLTYASPAALIPRTRRKRCFAMHNRGLPDANPRVLKHKPESYRVCLRAGEFNGRIT